MTRIMNKKIAAVALTAGLVLGGGGIAFAYFTADGSGTGSGSVGTSTAFTITGDVNSGSVTPGGDTMGLGFTVANPGSGNQYVSYVYASVSVDNTTLGHIGEVESIPGDTSSDVSGCMASWFSIDGTSTGNGTAYVNQTLAPSGSTDDTSSLTLVMNESESNQDACQGATVGIDYTTSAPV